MKITFKFQAIMGVSRSSKAMEGENQLEAVPLAWTLIDDADFEFQYTQTCTSLQHVFGLSPAEIFYDTSLFNHYKDTRATLYSERRLTFERIRSRLMKMEQHEMRPMLDDPAIIQATMRGTRKPQLELEPMDTCTLNFNLNLTADNVEGLLVVQVKDQNSRALGRVLVVNDADREEDIKILFKALNSTWGFEKIPKCAYMLARYTELIPPVETRKEVLRALDDPVEETNGNSCASSSLANTDSKMCDECGVMFPMKSPRHRQLYKQHLKEHFYKNFVCDCPGSDSFATLKEKEVHYRLHHSKLKYELCPQCGISILSYRLKKHLTEEHGEAKEASSKKETTLKKEPATDKQNACPVCGRLFKGGNHLSFHMTTHEKVKCMICNLEMIGRGTLRSHIRNFHSNISERKAMGARCEECNISFKCPSDEKQHMLRKHTPESEWPFGCEHCERRFVKKVFLRDHIIQVHLKTRPYKCRYGCGQGYNDHSSRCKHEKGSHGAIFPVEGRGKSKPTIALDPKLVPDIRRN